MVIDIGDDGATLAYDAVGFSDDAALDVVFAVEDQFAVEEPDALLYFGLMAAFIVIWVFYAGSLLSQVARPSDLTWHFGLAGPREEGLKILAALIALTFRLARRSGWSPPPPPGSPGSAHR